MSFIFTCKYKYFEICLDHWGLSIKGRWNAFKIKPYFSSIKPATYNGTYYTITDWLCFRIMRVK